MKASEEVHHIATAQGLTDHYFAASVNAVNLEDVFGKVESDCYNLVHGVVPFRFLTTTMLDAVGRPLHPIKL
ncbi:hypothetical protein ACDY96_29840, partial [Rhizobium mongolense]|uniref:hypothetical protein n=1 Tax=Rhizobium mongolense TaxID=57676 RepID=UPI0035560266